ncbi:MAG: AraC family transcriptional regulator [Prevotellaceae bacterium]|nr:AraC family transcriptional regulator [Prevotellaceae bacterium]
MKNFEIIFLIAVIFYGLAYIVLFGIIGFFPVIPYFCVFSAFNIIWVLNSRKVFDYRVRNFYLIRFYLFEMGVVMYPCALYLFEMEIYIFTAWYLLFPLVILLSHLRYDALKWFAYSVMTVISLFVTQHIFYFENYDKVTQEQKDSISIMTMIFMGIALAYFIFVFIRKMNLLNAERNLRFARINRVSESAENKPIAVAKNRENAETDRNDEHYSKVWQQIVEHFEKNEPFTNVNYKLSMLSSDININPSYVSRAIAANSSYNFSTLVNHFRIEKAKMMLAAGDLKRFSMEYIYTSAGFKYQSTFNDSFKKQEGITPTEFAKQ